MDYEIVMLEEKIAVGISARTNNTSPDMGAVIGGLWNRFFNEGVYASIPQKQPKKRWEFTPNTQEMKNRITQQSLPVKQRRSPKRATIPFAKSPHKQICEICCSWGYGTGSCGGVAGDLEHGSAKNIPV